MTETGSAAPLGGLRVIEVSSGVALVGAGLAASLPGTLLGDFGADVTRVECRRHLSLDDGVEWARVWNRGKEIVEVDEASFAIEVERRAAEADAVFISGAESNIEGRGLTYDKLARLNRRLVVARIRPSFNATGSLPDFELLVHARSGLLTQIRGHRPGPIFCDLTIGGVGAALAAAAGALACLYEREETGTGGWVETSLYDGMLAILPMIIGRVENPSPSIESKWVRGDPTPPLSFLCADGEYIQLWFGAKGAYEQFLEKMGDPPSAEGYATDLRSGAVADRSRRWAEKFATDDRASWLESLAGRDFRCEPVLRPGEALREKHLAEVGLSLEHDDPELGRLTVLGPVARVTSGPDGARDAASGRLLSGARVLDLSAYLAGPIAPLVLAELGADVVKVEPPAGDAHRGIEFMFAAGQRGKRAVALDLKSPGSAKVLRRLFEWSDVVHHNSRLGLAERLGYDENTVRNANPGVVYCHATGFGAEGDWAPLAANDHLMQALCGVEAAAGGPGHGPTYLDWGAIDVASGWLAACSMITGLFARRRTGKGQSVSTSLLGAGLTFKSGAFVNGNRVVEGPTVDGYQTGYGAAYRIYQASDRRWLAVAVSDTETWSRLLEAVGGDGLPQAMPPLRTTGSGPQQAEEMLEKVFAARAAADWVSTLTTGGVPAELVVEDSRVAFISGVLDDPLNQQLGRVVAFEWGRRGRLEQPGFPVRMGPLARPVARASIPELGEHTEEVLTALDL